MKLYRYTIGMYHGNKIGNVSSTDKDLLYQHCTTSPESMIRVARLFLWFRIMRKVPEIMTTLCFDMAKANIGWPVAVHGDLRWLSGSGKFAGAVGRSFEDWGRYMRDNSKCFRGQVEKFSKLRFADTYCPPMGPSSSHEQPATFACGHEGCPFLASSKQQLAIHSFKVHEVRSIWKNTWLAFCFVPSA